MPPSDSTGNIDLGEFYDTLRFQIHSHCKCDCFYLCGDFNSRCGDLRDFIAGVDSIPNGNVIDYTINKEGERLCEFFVDSNCCIMKGRNNRKNDFTFISSLGSSVIDYCIVPYEYMSRFPTSQLINDANIHSTLDSPGTYPDHSLLVWTILVDSNEVRSCSQTNQTVSFDVFDHNIPTDFLEYKSDVLSSYISKLEQDVSSQDEIDNIYSYLLATIKVEMYESLLHRTVKVKSGNTNLKRRIKKPWWSNRLSELWNVMPKNPCIKEKAVVKVNVWGSYSYINESYLIVSCNVLSKLIYFRSK